MLDTVFLIGTPRSPPSWSKHQPLLALALADITGQEIPLAVGTTIAQAMSLLVPVEIGTVFFSFSLTVKQPAQNI